MSAPLFVGDVLFYQRLLKASGYYNDTLDGIWGRNTDAADKAFEADSRELRSRHGTFDNRTEAAILTLHIKAQEKARQFMAALAGFEREVKIISGTRSYKEQDALFRQGRFGNPGPVVTKARGGQSNHNFCIAWDIGLFHNGAYLTGATSAEIQWYEKAAQFAPSGIEWGGNWTGFRDVPHYQLATGLQMSRLRERFENGQAYA